MFTYVYRHYENDRPIDAYSFHQLLTLLCPNFPMSFVENGMQILQTENKPKFSQMSKIVFMLFFYSEFVYEVSQIFKQNLSGENRVVPTQEFLAEISKMIQERSADINCPLEEQILKRT